MGLDDDEDFDFGDEDFNFDDEDFDVNLDSDDDGASVSVSRSIKVGMTPRRLPWSITLAQIVLWYRQLSSRQRLQ